ncbi:hypothetical protein [Pleionea mediterranea]|uniref:Uncharacterized protein n=1 Tax=Pleionea mediterranea TaxID=523701 RepID=A0A316FQ93_9GAMM|nr:hypothetical protein [Pleionea mediterranea]PWK49886.1 hypothetical protein C8D97_10747 [Pleionea mediterranea]
MEASDNDFYSVEHAASAIENLTVKDVLKLRLFIRARLFVGSRELTEDELISEAVSRTLEGVRRWNGKYTIVQHLIGVIKSISSDQRRKKGAQVEVMVEDLGSEMALIESTVSDSDNNTFDMLHHQKTIEAIFNEFKCDEVVRSVLTGCLNGENRAETIISANLSEKQYDAAKKRITRKALQMNREGQIL